MVRLLLASDQPQAMIAVRLNEVRPDGSVARITYGLLNLSHREDPGQPRHMVPGKFEDVALALNEIAQTVPAGHRLRLAVSTSYWPMAWPSPCPARITVDPAGSRIDLPVLEGEAPSWTFAPVEHAPVAPVTVEDPGSERREIVHDVESQTTTFRASRDDGAYVVDDIGTRAGYTKVKEFTVHRDDPASAVSRVACTHRYDAEDWHPRIATEIVMRCDATHFHLTARVEAQDGDEPFFERSFQHSFRRDHQ